MKLNTLNEVDWSGFRPTNISRAYSEAEVELQEDEDSLDEVWDEFNDKVNMTASELEQWSENPCSRQASVDPEAVIERNLRLLSKNKEDWTDSDIEDAKRTISFISRMIPNEPEEPRDGPHGCPSEWAISLLNWAYNPFESIPETPDNDDLEDVERIEMQDFKFEENQKVEWDSSGGMARGVVRDRTNDQCYDASIDGDVKVCGTQEDPAYLIELYDDEEEELTGTMVAHRESTLSEASFELGAEEKLMRPNYEFEPVPTQVLYDNRERAQQRAENIDLEGVHTHKFGGGQTMYMPGDTHSEWMAFIRGKKGKNVRDDQKSPTRMGGETVRGAEEVFNSQDMKESEEEESNAVRTEPSTIHEISGEDE